MSFWGDLAHFPFWADVWGNAAAWASGSVSSAALVAGATYYVLDRRQDNRSQASLVSVRNTAAIQVAITNHSDKTIVNVTVAAKILSLRKAATLGEFQQVVIFGGPTVAAFPSHDFYRNAKTVIKQMKGKTAELTAKLDAEEIQGGKEGSVQVPGLLTGGVLFYVTFRDAQGRDWSIEVSSNKLRQIRRRRHPLRWARSKLWTLWWISRNEAISAWKRLLPNHD
jgi:hypothetical protein